MYCLGIELPIIGTFLATFQIVVANDNYGTKGSNITLICPFMKGSVGGLQWSYINADLSTTTYSINENVNSENISPELYTRLSVTGNYTIGEYNLQIRNIQETDEGRYRCVAGIQEDQQGLYLIAPPSTVSIENVTFINRLLGNEGQDMMVSCVAVGGKPPPNVTLNIDGTSLATGNRSVKITLRYISRSYDRKNVTCLASNEANVNNSKSYSAMFYLNLRPLQPIFSQDPVSTEETRPLVVSCTSSGSRPQATFQWTIGPANVTSNSTTQFTVNSADDTYTVTSTLTYSVDRTNNGQTVTCGAYNNVSISGAWTNTTLDVKFAPYITVENETYDQNNANRTVSCMLAGNPTTFTYYRWQHKSTYGELIRELDGRQILILPNVPVEARYQDRGEYVCRASNGITGKDGKIQQTGSGYVTVNAQPRFTNGNNETKYGEFGKNVYILVHVYSVPKYRSLKWYHMNKEIVKANKYDISELTAIVHDTFHGTKVQLDGYRVTLTIKNLDQSDFNVSYRLELFYGVGQSVVYTTLLESASAPETPANFTVLNFSESSIVVEWEAGYNGGQDQTFFVEYRGLGSNIWIVMKIPDNKQPGRQTYTLDELKDGTSYELRMYAENKFNKSLPTEIRTIETIKDSHSSKQIGGIIGGMAGGLCAIFITIAVIWLIVFKRKQAGNNNQNGEYANAGMFLNYMGEGDDANAEDGNGIQTSNNNQQGLQYADLSFTKQISQKCKQPVISGREDTTLYCEVDHTKKAPLPPQESAYEETNFKNGF